MAEYAAIRDPDRRPAHPGSLLGEIIQETGRPVREIANLLGIPRQHLYDLMGERKPITPMVAVRLGKLLGNGPGVWVRMQAAHDIWQAERDVDLSSIPSIVPA